MCKEYNIKEVFSKRLKQLIDDKKINVKKFANDVKIPYSTVCDWINMKTFASIEHLPKVAYYFGVSTDYLLGVSDFE